jgi:putative ABC transport system ATP-binding protein
VEEEVEDEYESDDEEIKDDAKEVIKLVNVHKTYLLGLEGVPALRGVNLTINDGEFITILGTSGGGKTTLLNIIGTIDKPSKGDVYICGLRIKYSTKDQLLASIRLNKLGFVFQTFNLIGSLTALENVELPMQLRGKLSREQIRKRAVSLLEEVSLGSRLDHFPNQLSGGEQQRVTIARAIANNPSIILLDEPTGDLDTRSTDIVMKILLDLNVKKKITMIMVTHDVGLKTFANRVVRMADGKVNKIEIIDPSMRNDAIRHLDDRVRAIHSGNMKDVLTIREGIKEQDDETSNIKASGKVLIPDNFTALKNMTTTKTSVRRPQDYPVLRERFKE